jgi:cystathionine gamma-synthase
MYKIDTTSIKSHDTVEDCDPLFISTIVMKGLGNRRSLIIVMQKSTSAHENTISDLEYGIRGFACSSGIAASSRFLFQSGDEWLVSEFIWRYLSFIKQGYKKWGLKCQYVNTYCPEEIERKITPQTKAINLETPTNPLMKKTDISAVSEIAKKHGIMLIVDNTFYTPLLQQPITLGADIVIHSATKYLGGHNDVLAGLIVAKGKKLCEDLAHYHNSTGAVLSPFDSWLLMRGMKTLSLRMNRHEKNAKEVVRYLSNLHTVTDVFYPGRGGMISFRLKEESWINPFLQGLSLITFAESLGGTESFITYPATQTHADIPEETRIQAGVYNRYCVFSWN